MRNLLLLLLPCIALAAVIPSQPVTLGFTVPSDPTQMGGMTPNDFTTNFVLVFQSSPNCTVPTNQWSVIAAIPMSQFTNQGPLGTEWTNVFQSVSTPAFFLMRATNYLGGVGPFTSVATWVSGAPSGTIRAIR